MKELFFNVLWFTGAFAAGSFLMYVGYCSIKALVEEVYKR